MTVNSPPINSTPVSDALLSVLACPETGGSLVLEQDALVSPTNGTRYPLVGAVPWLLPSPSNSLVDWGAKLNHFNQTLLSEIKDLEKTVAQTDGATHERMQRLLQGKKIFLRRVSELLLPMVRAQASTKQAYDALRDRAPTTQNLLSYEANLYRDWVWGQEENKLTAEIVASLLTNEAAGKVVVIGAGAGRLALDLRRAWQAELTVATDINPLLVMAAEHLLSGNDLPFVEFPLQPRKSEFAAIEHLIHGEERPENFHFVFSDATKPSVKRSAFDVVVTPWFVDIQPLEFGRFLRQLNHYVPVGGQWINFGSLVFNQRREKLCYSIGEVQSIAEQQGFQIESIQEHEIPYLQSPYNAGYRMERVWSWTAKKIADVQAISSPQVLPPWLLDGAQPIPKAEYFQRFAYTHRVYAQLTSEVDGRTSISKIAKKFARQNKMEDSEAQRLVFEFFMDLHRQNA